MSLSFPKNTTNLKGWVTLDREHVSGCLQLYKKRSRMEIISDILISTKRKKSKTTIRNDTNMNFHQLQSYLSYLDKLKLLTKDKIDGTTKYRTTDKGNKFLEHFEEIKWLLNKADNTIYSNNFGDSTAPRGFLTS